MENKKQIVLTNLKNNELVEINGGLVDPVTTIAVGAAAVWGAWYSAWYAIGEAYGNYTKP